MRPSGAVLERVKNITFVNYDVLYFFILFALALFCASVFYGRGVKWINSSLRVRYTLNWGTKIKLKGNWHKKLIKLALPNATRRSGNANWRAYPELPSCDVSFVNRGYRKVGENTLFLNADIIFFALKIMLDFMYVSKRGILLIHHELLIPV